jgi:prolipoprotein diacylglyceryltransferase
VLIGGKTIVGGLLGAQLGVEVAKRIQGVHRSTGDAYVPPLVAGLILGRLGCFFSGVTDGTHGKPSTLPWAMDLGDGVLRHPTALYEVAFLLVLGAALALYGRRGLPGDRFAGFMVAYLAYRLFAEVLKVQPVWPFGLSSIQVACVLGLVGYALALPRRLRRGRAAATLTTTPPLG